MTKSRCFVVMVAVCFVVALFAFDALAEVLLNDSFSGAAGTLPTQVDTAAAGVWWGSQTSVDSIAGAGTEIIDDLGGDNGTASLAIPGFQGTGNRLHVNSTDTGGGAGSGGWSYVFWADPITGSGAVTAPGVVYVSFLYKPIGTGNGTMGSFPTWRPSADAVQPRRKLN